MKSAEVDPFFLYRKDENGCVEDLVCLQVDDSIGAGTKELLRDEATSSRRFKTRTAEILDDQKEI